MISDIRRGGESASRNISRRLELFKYREILPSATKEMIPVSSLTTTATASVSSVIPIAALWRVPSSFDSFGLSVRGRKQLAAAALKLLTMAAPSSRVVG